MDVPDVLLKYHELVQSICEADYYVFKIRPQVSAEHVLAKTN